MLASATTNAVKGTLWAQPAASPSPPTTAAGPDYDDVIIAYRNGAVVRVKDVGHAVEGPENLYTPAWDNNNPAVLLIVFKQPGANVIETVDLIKKALPRLQAVIPPAVTVDLLSDRTTTIRASVEDVEFTLAITIGLVFLVILLFLRNLRVTVIPSLVVPLSLLGAAAVMYAAGFSLDNLSLMALTILSVVDDAIVVVENIYRHIEMRLRRSGGALGRAISFTCLISLSPVVVQSGSVDGGHQAVVPRVRHHRHGGNAASAFVNLTPTPMLCARFLHRESERHRSG